MLANVIKSALTKNIHAPHKSDMTKLQKKKKDLTKPPLEVCEISTLLKLKYIVRTSHYSTN